MAAYEQDGGEIARLCSHLRHGCLSGILAKGSGRVSIHAITQVLCYSLLSLLYNNKKRLKRETAKVGRISEARMV